LARSIELRSCHRYLAATEETAALAEWITNGTFDGAQAGKFPVDASGVARSPGT